MSAFYMRHKHTNDGGDGVEGVVGEPAAQFVSFCLRQRVGAD